MRRRGSSGRQNHLRVLASALWLALGSRTRREILSRFASGRLKVGRAGKPQRLVAAATRLHRQDTAWGTPGQLVGGTVWVQVADFFRGRWSVRVTPWFIARCCSLFFTCARMRTRSRCATIPKLTRSWSRWGHFWKPQGGAQVAGGCNTLGEAFLALTLP